MHISPEILFLKHGKSIDVCVANYLGSIQEICQPTGITCRWNCGQLCISILSGMSVEIAMGFSGTTITIYILTEGLEYSLIISSNFRRSLYRTKKKHMDRITAMPRKGTVEWYQKEGERRWHQLLTQTRLSTGKEEGRFHHINRNTSIFVLIHMFIL